MQKEKKQALRNLLSAVKDLTGQDIAKSKGVSQVSITSMPKGASGLPDDPDARKKKIKEALGV